MYQQKAWKAHISKYDYTKFKDQELRRRFQIISVLGTSALNESRLAQVRGSSNLASELICIGYKNFSMRRKGKYNVPHGLLIYFSSTRSNPT